MIVNVMNSLVACQRNADPTGKGVGELFAFDVCPVKTRS
jgi:hypothetical protein